MIMKFIVIFFFAFIRPDFAFTQNRGKIISKKLFPIAGETNIYIFQPSKYLAIPKKIFASVVYQNNDKYYYKSFLIKKIKGDYTFSLRVPDSTEVMILTVVNEKNKLIDDNNGLGFISYFYNRNGKKSVSSYIQAAYMLSYYAPRFLGLDWEKLKGVMIKLYETAYRLSPILKKESIYTYYLMLLYEQKKESVRPQLLAYAKQMSSSKFNQNKWMKAIKIYHLLNMDEQQKEVEDRAIRTYPDGLVAKNKFLTEFYKKPGISEQAILADMHEYITRFKDTSAQTKYTFYVTVIEYLLNKNYWDRLSFYEPLMNDKLTLASLYNKSAWALCGGQLNQQGEQMYIAKLLAKKSLNYVADTLKKLAPDDNTEYLQDTYNSYADTYALILYNLGKYDSAFYYQNNIYKQEKEVDVGVLERYSLYAEKVKGLKFAKQVIEKELLNGINSPAILNQLKSIYKKMGIPENEFDKLSEKTAMQRRLKAAELIKSHLGTTKAPDFILKNIQGKNVSLSSLRHKVVVLDFWATWCGPCRASFPDMQQEINKYSKDSTVVFLFIDVWENKSLEEMQETAAKFIKDNNYNFNILLDVNNKVVNDYKVESIPAKFVIDKKGNVVFIGNEKRDLGLIIENERTNQL